MTDLAAEAVEELEAVGHATWPALEEAVVDGWLVRAANGVTRRSNSVNPGAHTPPDLDAAVASSIAWLAERGLPPIFRLTSLAPAGLNELLAERGLSRVPGADIMTRAVPSGPAASDVEVLPTRSAEWTDVLSEQEDRGGTARETVEALLDSHTNPTAFALLRVASEPVSVGMAVATGRHVGIFNMRTKPEHRRAGHALRVLDALLGFGEENGADTAFLQVHPENAGAIGLYRAAGFSKQYEYWYVQ